MSSEFRQAGPQDRERVVQFLKETFHATGDEPGLETRQMQWKYEETASSAHAWTCRNYIIERDGRILAHAGVWPVRMLSGGREYPGAHLIDWAASRESQGAGVSLLQKLAREQKVIYGLGGSEMTRKIFPSLGFRPLAAPIGYYARPLRPVRQILTHPRRWHWKAPARLLRNTWWSRTPHIELDNWTAEAMEPGKYSLWPSSQTDRAVFHRDAAGFEYLSRCPVIHTSFHGVLSGGSIAGYFLLVFVPGQARIVDAWVEDGRGWAKLFALAGREAYKNPDVAELTTIAGLPEARAALAACGFHQIKEEQLMVYDPKRILPAASSVHFQLVDNDACYLRGRRPEYQT